MRKYRKDKFITTMFPCTTIFLFFFLFRIIEITTVEIGQFNQIIRMKSLERDRDRDIYQNVRVKIQGE